MIGKGTNSTKPVTLPEVLDILEHRRASGDIGYEQQTCYDYANKFAKITKAKAEKLVEDICGNEKIKPETAVKIIDIMPKYKSQLNIILLKDKCELSDKEKEKVLELVASVKQKERKKAEEAPAEAPAEEAEAAVEEPKKE